jgi:hypothetical protein
VTSGCGVGTDFRKGLLKKGAGHGDDACFVARHRPADVLDAAAWPQAAGSRAEQSGQQREPPTAQPLSFPPWIRDQIVILSGVSSWGGRLLA